MKLANDRFDSQPACSSRISRTEELKRGKDVFFLDLLPNQAPRCCPPPLLHKFCLHFGKGYTVFRLGYYWTTWKSIGHIIRS